MKIVRKSVITGRLNSMDLPVTEEQIARWQGGELIQCVMPGLDAVEREFLISGITPTEWFETFGAEETA